MKERSTGSRETGVVTLEILIAFAILVMAMGAVVLVAFGSETIAVDAENTTEALSKDEKMVEETRTLSRLDFNLVNPSTESEASGPLLFSKVVTMRQLDLFTKQATSTVSWLAPGRLATVVLSTIFTNSEAGLGGSTCSSIVPDPEGWKTPEHHDFPLIDLLGGGVTGTVASNVAVFNRRLYLTAVTTPNATAPSLFIFDLPDDPTQAPVYRGSVDNNSHSLTGLYGVAVGGNYAYIANAYPGSASTCTEASNCAQLQVIDVSASTPVVVANLKIPAVTTGGKLAAGITVAYYKGYVYLGLAKASSGSEFNVIDVGGGGAPASPTNPIWKGGYPLRAGVNQIVVKGTDAYVASAGSPNLQIIDIGDPTNPTLAGTSPALLGGNNGESVGVVGNTVYLGRTFGSNEFYILNAALPASVVSLGSKDIGGSNQTSIYGLAVRNNLAFFLTNNQFQIWDITNPASMTSWAADSLVGNGIAMTCEGDRLYAALGSSALDNTAIISIITSKP